MGMLDEFKEFAVKGNAMDLAVGVILGGAFGGIVNSLVADVMMPPIGKALGGVDFSSLFIDLSGTNPATLAAAKEAGAATINYGVFLNAIINFVIVAVVLFSLVRTMNRLRKPAPAPAPAAPTTKTCPHCALDIPIAAKRCGHCTSTL